MQYNFETSKRNNNIITERKREDLYYIINFKIFFLHFVIYFITLDRI